MPRVIFFETTNAAKAAEVATLFDRYGIKLVTKRPEHANLFARIREQSTLEALEGEDQGSLRRATRPPKMVNLERVLHRSTLIYEVFQSKEGTDKVGSFSHNVEGYLDLSRAKEGAFGFDSIFVVPGVDRTFHELKQAGFKQCARDHCVSDFIKEFLYRTQLGDWCWHPQEYKRPIELHRDPWAFFETNEYVNNPFAVQYGMVNLIKTVLNQGLFFRASENRRQNLYWFPGLNAGIPFTKKPKDPLHELIFFVHDMVHQAIPDLIYTGEADRISRFVYVTHRMLSEATTLVSADMYFADSVLRAGFKYDTIDNRRIYPLFKSMKSAGSFGDQKTLQDLLRANARFCLLGDSSGLKAFDPEKRN
uniref:Uncharacterized protein n=1 Tax=Chromera velia CCMP2878 TaxID=1169474 RepID=A0A0G4I4H2_9ALVE|eukprot:Cvel_1800.t1-p1 / transcript=Cvel_1800.t1 / gene=Cvel_1800 / organism=Chromera_velia_CCMP2878 / gene_product=hypothetical protein / transcript_product=hypothetical protein / location=Cvel_scaffold66:60511-63267(-) / protein_length=362 / sequence_SO=supercontig / SO=protein_coding / is_pseudo=false